jgi:Mrp family chromosome partitioning ATPase
VTNSSLRVIETPAGKQATLPPASPLESVIRQIEFRAEPGSGVVVGITSTIEGEGKSTVSRELALGLAKLVGSERPVLLVDCGEPPPLNAKDAHGRIGWEEVFGAAGVHFRTLPTLRAEQIVFRGATLPETFTILRRRYSFTILDLPAVMSDPLAVDLARAVDQLYLVVRAGCTPRQLLRQAAEQLDPARLECVILNDVRRRAPRWLSRLVS